MVGNFTVFELFPPLPVVALLPVVVVLLWRASSATLIFGEDPSFEGPFPFPLTNGWECPLE